MKRKQESIASFFVKHLSKESGDKSNPTPSSIASFIVNLNNCGLFITFYIKKKMKMEMEMGTSRHIVIWLYLFPPSSFRFLFLL
jgi:hypothetical protein